MRIETEAQRRVVDLVQQAPLIGRMVLLTGPHGWGKTEAARQAAERLPRLAYVPLDPFANSGRGLWSCLARGLALPVGRSDGAADLVRLVTDKLSVEGTLLILDHAEHLRPGSLPLLRHLVDVVERLVVVGDGGVRCDYQEHAALAARMSFQMEMPEVAEAELQAALSEEFSTDWIATAHRVAWGKPDLKAGSKAGGFGFSTIVGMAEIERNRSAARRRPTTDATAEDAARVAQLLLARAA